MSQGEGCGSGGWRDGCERYLHVGSEQDLLIEWCQAGGGWMLVSFN